MANFSDQFNGNIARICSNCEKEQRIEQKPITSLGWRISHSVCPRHSVAMLKMAGISDEDIKKFVEKTSSKQSPVKDLNEPENKELVNWFKNPTPAPEATAKAAE